MTPIMRLRTVFLATLSLLQVSNGEIAFAQAKPAVTPQADGIRGIWFELGQKFEHGDKYSGGLGTYTANHVPMAHYVEKVNRTYFTWGGTPSAKQRRLQILISYYDHSSGEVARPVVVMDKGKVDDPHDNGSLSIDGEGHLWVFVSGRGRTRPGRIYRSKVPYEIDKWLNLGDSEFTYPQPWWFEGKGFLHTYTRYTPGRELYYRTSRDGTWKIIGPTGTGPQKWGAGGEIELWTSADRGATWEKQRDVTENSPRNHSYARRPRNAHPDFYAYWADGNADTFSESHLWFTNKSGNKVWQLPYTMTGDFAAPILQEQ